MYGVVELEGLEVLFVQCGVAECGRGGRLGRGAHGRRGHDAEDEGGGSDAEDETFPRLLGCSRGLGRDRLVGGRHWHYNSRAKPAFAGAKTTCVTAFSARRREAEVARRNCDEYGRAGRLTWSS